MTTSLFNELANHTRLFKLPKKKELNYFLRKDASYKSYKKLFKYGDGNTTLEASPYYIFNSDSMERISKVLGENVSLIILRRDPVERTISHYFHSLVRGHENRKLFEAITGDIRNYSSYSNEYERIHFSYLNRSNYEFLEKKALDIFPENLFIFDTSKETISSIAKIIIKTIDSRYEVNNSEKSISLKAKNKAFKISGVKRFKFLKRAGFRGKILIWIGLIFGALSHGKTEISDNDKNFIYESINSVKKLNSTNTSL